MRYRSTAVMKKTVFALGLLLILVGLNVVDADIRLPSIIGDNMVLQRDMKAPIWGWADPSEEVRLSVSWQRRERRTVADQEGKWQFTVTAPPAGGPYEITLKGKNAITLRNILVGEVWICSGQSNMEWPVRESNNAEQETAAADYPEIRLFTVKKKIATTPESDCTGHWSVCAPETISDFSAVGYFFGRHLHKELGVPVGLIHTSWGGTLAEAWTSRDALEKMSGFQAEMDRFAEVYANPNRVREKYRNEMAERREKLEAAARQYRERIEADLDDAGWREMDLPGHWEKAALPGFDGMVWFRKVVDIPEFWAGKKLTLELGPIDDRDTTWVNGVKVGAHTIGEHWKTPRIYEIDEKVLRPGRNVIVVQVLDTGREGGFWGKPGQMKISLADAPDEDTIPLAGPWRYKAGVSIPREPTNWLEYPNHPTALYNGMLAPLIPYGMRGAIWYQGESNTGRAYQYRELFPTMITDWRQNWDQGQFSFLFVQLANYMSRQPEPTESVWAELREAQLMTLKHPNTGMATIIDIGEAEDIHPRNKQDVGKRLALWALGMTYGQDLVYSGPLYQSMTVNGGTIVLQFDYVGGGLMVKGDALRGFAIAGADRQFVWADARIEGDTVVVRSSKVADPVAVRYAWADNPVCNLYNRAGLPASPFRTDDWPGLTANNQ